MAQTRERREIGATNVRSGAKMNETQGRLAYSMADSRSDVTLLLDELEP